MTVTCGSLYLVFQCSLYSLNRPRKKPVTLGWSNERSGTIIRLSRLRTRDGIASIWGSINCFLAFRIPCRCTWRPKYDSYVLGFSARKPASLRSTISSSMKYYLFFCLLNMLQNASNLCCLKSVKKHVGIHLHLENLCVVIDIKTISVENTEDILVPHSHYLWNVSCFLI